MACSYAIYAVFLCVGALVASAEQRADSQRQRLRVSLNRINHVEKAFKNFVDEHKKSYASDLSEYHERSAIFRDNLNKIDKLNRQEASNKLASVEYGVNMFADMTPMEFSKQKLGLKRPLSNGVNLASVSKAQLNFTEEWNRLLKEEGKSEEELLKSLPTLFDWRQHKGVVTGVKDQGQCGSCWAFATTGSVEGQYGIKRNASLSLSEQELLDCDTADSACSGGLPEIAYGQIIKLGGLETEKDYPYKAKQQKTCKLNKKEKKFSIDGFVSLPTRSEDKMRIWLVKRGPLSIGINADMMTFYNKGILHPNKMDCVDTQEHLDHGVLIVGYGQEEVKNQIVPYWIIKNSWTSNWGEKGFFRIYRGENTCGLALIPSSAVLHH